MEEDMETGGSRPGTGEGFSICGSENIFDCSSTTLIANLRSDFFHQMRRKFEQKLKAEDQRLIWIGDKVWFAGCFLVVGGLSTVIKLSSWIWLVSNLTFVLEWGEIVNRSLKLTTNSYSEFETKFVWLVVDSTTILQFNQNTFVLFPWSLTLDCDSTNFHGQARRQRRDHHLLTARKVSCTKALLLILVKPF